MFLWELSTYGQKPYHGMANIDAHYQVMQGYRLPSTSLTDGILYSIMRKCWNENPRLRPTSSYVHTMLEQAKVGEEELAYDKVTFKRSATFSAPKKVRPESAASDSVYMQPVVADNSNNNSNNNNSSSSGGSSKPYALVADSAEQQQQQMSGAVSSALDRSRARTMQARTHVADDSGQAPPKVPPRHSTIRSAQQRRLSVSRVKRPDKTSARVRFQEAAPEKQEMDA